MLIKKSSFFLVSLLVFVPSHLPCSFLVAFLDCFAFFPCFLLRLFLPLLYGIDNFLPLAFAGLVTLVKEAVELLLIGVAAFGLDLLLEAGDLLQILAFFPVALSLLVRLHGLVELLVLEALLALLEVLDLHLLLQEPALHLRHVLVRLQHLREEVVRPANGDFGLD